MKQSMGAIVLAFALVLPLGPSNSAAQEKPAAKQQNLCLDILRAAPDILKYVREKEYRNVGVLKFRVKKGDAPPADNVGTLNQDVARMLELGLILTDEVDDKVCILRDASATAASIKGANHLTAEGRRALFTGRYQPAWKQKQDRVSANAFLTGEVSWSASLKSMTVVVTCFDSKSGKMEEVTRFDTKPGADELARGGESFRLRGEEDDPAEVAAFVRGKGGVHPLDPRAKDRPLVTLEVRYGETRDGKVRYTPVPLDFEEKPGEAWVAEPRKGQKVQFLLRRTPAAERDRLGIVFKLNGENTLYSQRLDDYSCSKWVLDADATELVIDGFQKDAKTALAFEVLSPAESKANEINYTADIGKISLVVFREAKVNTAKKPKLTDAERMRAVLAAGTMPTTVAENQSAAREQIQAASSPLHRGEIVGGEKTDSKLTAVKFVAARTPVQVAIVGYYRPNQGK